VASRSEVLGDRSIGREEPLRMTRRFEPLHAPLTLACRLMGVLRAVVEIAVLTVFHTWEYFPLRRAIAFELVCDEHPRDVSQPFEQLAEKLLQVMTFAIDGRKHPVQVPLVTRPGPVASELIGIRLPELQALFADGLVGDDDPTSEQELFDIPIAQAEAEVQPNAVADKPHRELMTLVEGSRVWYLHAASMPHEVRARKVARVI
jgi:hypothetical protein